MSYGLVCLNCRKYIAKDAVGDQRWCCECPQPRPSWDAKTDAGPNAIKDWRSGKREM